MKTSDDLLHELADNIRARRLGQGWSQKDAASVAGVSSRTWQRLERDGQATTVVLGKAAIALRCGEGLSQLFIRPAAALDEHP